MSKRSFLKAGFYNDQKKKKALQSEYLYLNSSFIYNLRQLAKHKFFGPWSIVVKRTNFKFTKI